MINYMNSLRDEHIITIEDPIEYMHTHNKCLVNQRELGADTQSFGNALRGALRQDPDVILVGEMRDKETIEIALRAAETGHLVLSTLHTNATAAGVTPEMRLACPTVSGLCWLSFCCTSADKPLTLL